MDYLSSSTRTKISETFDNVHETFKQDIVVYKDAENTITAMTPSYNSIYGSGGSSALSITKTSVQKTIGARIKYISSDEDYFISSELNSQMKITIPRGSIRIKISSADFDYIKEAKRIEFNGVRYNIVSDGLPIGPFSPAYYAVFLTPIDESA
jgi:hypothetical protein